MHVLVQEKWINHPTSSRDHVWARPSCLSVVRDEPEPKKFGDLLFRIVWKYLQAFHGATNLEKRFQVQLRGMRIAKPRKLCSNSFKLFFEGHFFVEIVADIIINVVVNLNVTGRKISWLKWQMPKWVRAESQKRAILSKGSWSFDVI